MKIKIGLLLITATVLLDLSACSYVKSLFPDKEKDYQYTTEIPPLILPEELKKDQIPAVPAPSSSASSAPTSPQPGANAEAAMPAVAVNTPVDKEASTAPTATESAVTPSAPATETESELEVPDTEITIERVKFNEGENRLRMNAPFIKAWRMVNKALSRKSIEVTGRDQESGLFTIQYAPDEKKVEDGSYWDEVRFIFSGIQTNEKTYQLKLEKNNQQTDILVVDEDKHPQSDAGSVKLLTLLQETMKADLAKKISDQAKSKHESDKQ